MNLFDWMDAWYNNFISKPNDTSSFGVEISMASYMRRVLIRISISFLIIYYFFLIRMGSLWAIEFKTVAIFSGIFIFYCFMGYVIQPKPDTSNLGWFGGLVNIPFRISDNINRVLLFFKFILWPGRFISESVVDSIDLLIRNKDAETYR